MNLDKINTKNDLKYKRQMNKEQKRALYESIMIDVAKIVKRHINEYSQEEMMEDRRK